MKAESIDRRFMRVVLSMAAAPSKRAGCASLLECLTSGIAVLNRRRTQTLTLAALAVIAGWQGFAPRTASAQLSRGYDQIAPSSASGEERNRQSNLRVMEVQMKPMRMLWVDVTNPKTGAKERRQIWYLVYRAITRPTPGRTDETDTKPVNVVDDPPKPVEFMPEAILTTYDDPANPVPDHVYHDEILPEVLAAIRTVEQRPAAMYQRRPIADSLSVIQPFPEPVAETAAPEEQDWVYGVFVWSNVDPETDFFSVTLRGFSNGFDASKTGPDGKLQPWRKVIVQKFTRRGDRFDPNSREFEFSGEPQWTYQPDEIQWGQWTPATKNAAAN